MASYFQPDDHDPERIDRLLLKNIQRDVFGASAFHGLDPAQMCIALEDLSGPEHAIHERSALRAEIFSGFLEYLFADGPEPAEVRSRIEGFLQSFHPKLAAAIKGPQEWVDPQTVCEVLKKAKYAAHLRAKKEAAKSRGALSTWVKSLEAEGDLPCVGKTIVALIQLITSEAKTWKSLTATAYSIAKSLRPHLIAGMSLEDIAVLSGDSGRATPSHRGKRLISRRLEQAGAKSTHSHYQKSSEAVEKYRAAQMGNHNRQKAAKSKKRSPKK